MSQTITPQMQAQIQADKILYLQQIKHLIDLVDIAPKDEKITDKDWVAAALQFTKHTPQEAQKMCKKDPFGDEFSIWLSRAISKFPVLADEHVLGFMMSEMAEQRPDLEEAITIRWRAIEQAKAQAKEEGLADITAPTNLGMLVCAAVNKEGKKR